MIAKNNISSQQFTWSSGLWAKRTWNSYICGEIFHSKAFLEAEQMFLKSFCFWNYVISVFNCCTSTLGSGNLITICWVWNSPWLLVISRFSLFLVLSQHTCTLQWQPEGCSDGQLSCHSMITALNSREKKMLSLMYCRIFLTNNPLCSLKVLTTSQRQCTMTFESQQLKLLLQPKRSVLKQVYE